MKHKGGSQFAHPVQEAAAHLSRDTLRPAGAHTLPSHCLGIGRPPKVHSLARACLLFIRLPCRASWGINVWSWKPHFGSVNRPLLGLGVSLTSASPWVSQSQVRGGKDLWGQEEVAKLPSNVYTAPTFCDVGNHASHGTGSLLPRSVTQGWLCTLGCSGLDQSELSTLRPSNVSPCCGCGEAPGGEPTTQPPLTAPAL